MRVLFAMGFGHTAAPLHCFALHRTAAFACMRPTGNWKNSARATFQHCESPLRLSSVRVSPQDRLFCSRKSERRRPFGAQLPALHVIATLCVYK